MTQDAGGATPLARHRFAVASDGTVSGTEPSSDQLAASLRYATRMATQLDPVLGIGRLEWLTTLSSTAVTARVAQGEAGAVSLTAEVEQRETTTRSHDAERESSAQRAVNRALGLVHDVLMADWCAAITVEDKRLIGVRLPPTGRILEDPEVILSTVGDRVLAVLGALHRTYRETAVVLDYRQGSLMIADAGDAAVFAFADKFDSAAAGRVVSRVRSSLAGQDLAHVWTFGA